MTRNRLVIAAVLLMVPVIAPAAGPPPRLGLPVQCRIVDDCLVQKLVDLDPGPGRSDYRCGTLTTDGHDGIDIRVRTLADMRAGVAVVAAAPGRVLRTRDGEPDISVKARGDLGGRDAGNSVIVDHGDGWQTQYSHLRQGSVMVRPGDVVGAAAEIGKIGMSGNAEFPHLHFTLRHNAAAVDPFIGRAAVGCRPDGGAATLWTPAAAAALRYRPTMLIAAGIGPAAPTGAVVDREGAGTGIAADAPLLLWAQVIGAAPGDTQGFQIRDAAERMIVDVSRPVDRGGLYWLGYSGRRAPPGGWPAGTYSGRYQYLRGGVLLFEREFRISMPGG